MLNLSVWHSILKLNKNVLSTNTKSILNIINFGIYFIKTKNYLFIFIKHNHNTGNIKIVSYEFKSYVIDNAIT